MWGHRLDAISRPHRPDTSPGEWGVSHAQGVQQRADGGPTVTLAGAGLAVGAGIRAWRGRRHRDTLRGFLEWNGPSDPSVDVGVAGIALPIRYWRTDCFMGVFPADYGAVRDLLPSSRLYPVRLLGAQSRGGGGRLQLSRDRGRPLRRVSGQPAVHPRPRRTAAAPLLLGRWHGFGGFVAHLPVTSRVAREAGRRIWGYPKFVADMAFELLPEHQQVTLTETGREILRLGVRRAGWVGLERAPLSTFTVLDTRLIRTTVAMRGYVATALGASCGELTLGDHPVGRELTSLGLAATRSSQRRISPTAQSSR